MGAKKKPDEKAPAKPAATTGPAKTKKGKPDSKDGKKVASRRRNFKLPGGLMRHSKSNMFHRHGLWNKKKAEKPSLEELKKIRKEKRKPRFVVKKIGGEKNGGTRVVRLKKARKYYPTEDRPKKKGKKPFLRHKCRSTLKPGTVCILLAGNHRGKRVVLLKQLRATGLLLVTGPMAINGCPMRRINQRYVIATSTRIDVSGVKLPLHINDVYFNREHKKKSRAPVAGGDIFDTKPEPYTVSEERKKDQAEVDAQVIAIIRAHKESTALKNYLKTPFSLRSKQYPHRMTF